MTFLRYLSAIQEASDETHLLVIFSCLRFGPRIRTEGLNSIPRKIVSGSFLVPYCLWLLLPFPFWPNQVPHVVGLIFFLRNKFLFYQLRYSSK